MEAHALRAAIRFALIGLLFCVGIVRCSPAPSADAADSGALLGELARSGLARSIAPRLSIPFEHRPCSLHTPPDGTLPQTECEAERAATAPSDRILDIAARASARVRTEVDPEALHTVALIDLLWADGAGNSLQRSISYLQTASRLTERPAPVLADLAAAYLVRAERTQNPRDLLEAIEAAEGALQLEPASETARFNLALALDRLALDGQAAEAWRRYLLVDATSGWAAEARERSQVLARVHEPPSPPAFGAPAAEIAAYVARAPQEARLFGWDDLLGEWGEAVLEGDSARAADRLRLAAAIGEALETRGGDATLADAVRAIRGTSGERGMTWRLARAHLEYARARAAHRAADNAVAAARLAILLADDPPSSPLLGWAQMLYAAALIPSGRLSEAERRLRALLTTTDADRHAALAGGIYWALATTLLRRGHFQHAREAAEEAARLFEAVGEHQHLGGARYLVADTEFALRVSASAYPSMHRALMILRPYRSSVWLHNLLSVAAEAAAADGLVRAALCIQGEGVAVAEAIGHPAYAAEARLWYAQFLAMTGDVVRASADIEAGLTFVQKLEPGDVRSWLEADIRLTRAALALRDEPAHAAAALDSVIVHSGGTRTALRLLRALVARAEARLTLGDVQGATLDLEHATSLLDEQRAAIASTPLRASLFDAARAIFDRLVMLRVANQQPSDALAYLERGRLSFASSRREAPEPAGRHWRIPPGSVIVEYALIGDTLLSWVVTDSAVHLTSSTLDHTELTRSIERVRSSLELRADEATVRPHLEMLYRWLVRPIEERLGPEGTDLVLVTDGELSAIPFAALYDTARRRYLIERYPLRFVASARDAARQPTRAPGAEVSVLLVADPELDRHAHAGLGGLPGAALEVATIAANYTHPRVLHGARATRSALTSALQEASIFHFAGHAVFDDERPEHSFLILARERREGGADRITAADLETLDLRHLRLVVLSACQTLRSRAGRSGGFAGFTGALLAAGTEGVVGSLWKVDDELTRELMVQFHRAYRLSGNGPDALRTAQRRLLESDKPALQSPAAWAAFRYTGR